VYNSELIKEKLKSKDYWNIKEAERLLNESDTRHHESKQKKWVVMILGTILGGLIGYFVPVELYDMATSKYDRTMLDTTLDEMFGGYRFEDSLTDEVLMIAFSYNLMEPRFYSKVAEDLNPNVYNVTIALATEASASAPTYF